LPFDKLFDGVKYVPSVKPYRTIKVRILNGAHTSMIPFALNRSVPSVGECLKNDEVSAHLAECLGEIVDSLDIDRSETEAYAKSVLERFANPYIYHKCASISLNSVSKFKVRVLPSILDYERKFGKAPSALIRAFAELIKFYKEGTPSDSPDAMEKLKNGTVEQILSDTELWGEDLSRFSSLVKW
jgi:tagaturonate reductase